MHINAVRLYTESYETDMIGREVSKLMNKATKIMGAHKFWLEMEGEALIGKGRYRLLKSIAQTHSLKESAKESGVSLRTAHNHLRKIEARLGKKITSSVRGGPQGGGKVMLTRTGEELIHIYEETAQRYKHAGQ